ncbi:hypothetical protein Desor_0997 [Desulfosporosinus orientis DSM 765]|uniref:Tfp pilus assembly protein PilN n=1 Tax=Desulfosporosinus orientis (strain ATCC 19365 / DSM 765 / NCIMB 8382 / VKM B-1628 / Singapore I) TaxID=768706 RepID=G7W5M5_DESOD|nr:PilN domain-containing protein [Desulfosporosinus orientis]AET66672.1 hypothetical protein Desor_0997 [Desulfosporosinus orientis DSM 765]
MRRKHNFNFALAWKAQLRKESSNGRFYFRTEEIIIFISVLLGLIVIASSPWIWNYKLNLDLTKTNNLILSFKNIDEKVQKLNTLTKQVQNLKSVSELSERSTHDPGPVLEKIRLLLPIGTKIKSFSLQADNSLLLVVSIPTPVDVARLWTSLQNSNLFQNVDIQTISLLDQSQDFNLSLKIK